MVTKEYVRKVVSEYVEGIVVGGVKMSELFDLSDYKIGVAITGKEAIGLTMIVTEGFGKTNMTLATYSLLKFLEGKLASINGETQRRAGVIRSEIIVPLEKASSFSNDEEKDSSVESMEIGTRVRIIRGRYFGSLGYVTSLPVYLKKIETESYVRVAEIEIDSREKVIVTRAKLELVEE